MAIFTFRTIRAGRRNRVRVEAARRGSPLAAIIALTVTHAEACSRRETCCFAETKGACNDDCASGNARGFSGRRSTRL